MPWYKVTCFPTFAAGYTCSTLPLHISRAFCWLHLFPRFTLVTLFPYLALLHTFPSLPLAKCFPALRTGYNFSRSCNSTLTMNALASVKRFSSYGHQATCVFSFLFLLCFISCAPDLSSRIIRLCVTNALVRKPYHAVVTIRSVFYIMSHSEHYIRMRETDLFARGQRRFYQ